MDALELINRPSLVLTVVDGDLKVKSERPLAPELRIQLKQHKAEIIGRLSLPKWCKSDCKQLEYIDLPGEGSTPGCIIKHSDFETWRRLDKMHNCPTITGWHRAKARQQI